LRLVAGGWFVLREKYCWLVADKPSEQAGRRWTKNQGGVLWKRWELTRVGLHGPHAPEACHFLLVCRPTFQPAASLPMTMPIEQQLLVH
jgi:hypothetical protein